MTGSPSARQPKVTADVLDVATNMKVVGRAGIGVYNVDIPAASARGVVVMNTPFGNSIHHRRACDRTDVRAARGIARADASTQGRQVGEEPLMGVELTSKTLGLIGAAISARSSRTGRSASR
jgi:D-3-phosphoglycerate dehydrogenase